VTTPTHPAPQPIAWERRPPTENWGHKRGGFFFLSISKTRARLISNIFDEEMWVERGGSKRPLIYPDIKKRNFFCRKLKPLMTTTTTLLRARTWQAGKSQQVRPQATYLFPPTTQTAFTRCFFFYHCLYYVSYVFY